jgi:hypothetical protein
VAQGFARQAADLVSTQVPMGLMARPVLVRPTVKMDQINSGIAFARRAGSLVVPSQPWMLAKGENSLRQPEEAPELP